MRTRTRSLPSRVSRGSIALLVLLLVAGLSPASAQEPLEEIVDAVARTVTSAPDLATGPLVAPGRETEVVVLTGADVPAWSAPGDQTLHVPDLGGARCQGNEELFGDTPVTPDELCTHNRYEDPTLSSQDAIGAEGTPVDQLLAYRWTGGGFEQIPFQVDEVFTRYLSNNVSGFSVYSNTDEHTSYAFDREGFRWTGSHPEDPCLAVPASEVATDPVPGLDTLDELAFMASDAGVQAPSGADLPGGILDAYEVTVVDPYRPDSPGYVYLARAADDGPRSAFDATNGYVHYERDEDADVFVFSQSSYSNYGRAPEGPYVDETGECTDEVGQRRPKDTATVTTPRYRFRYDGRWLMTEIAVSDDENGDWSYGRNLVDRWKARAFQQRPGGQTPCCGYEEEENNWGGSSQLLGELTGPVRAIRETWGADSGTNVIRRETFTRDEIEQTTFLRVHVIPPLDGIYAQWDHAATAVSTYYNPHVPDGVPIDGENDEVFGNNRIHVGLDGASIDGDDSTSELIRDVNGGTPLVIGEPNEPRCAPMEPFGGQYDGWDDLCVYNDVDTTDPLFSGPSALLAWEQIAGENGTLITRWSSDVEDITTGGAVHAGFALPYYRDDACFDDGTGSDPGPHLNQRREDTGEHAVWADEDGEDRPRECWDADRHDEDVDYAADLGTERFWQGSIGTHGLHLLLIADSDNANATKPVTEIVSSQRIVVLPPTLDNVGEQYGRGFEKPLIASATPFDTASPSEQPTGTWLAGDLHVHTTYSHDAWAPGQDGDPWTLGWGVGEQFVHAATRGLDFLAITDHNDIRSQDDPGFGSKDVIGVPGYEKSLDGHAQMLGATRIYDDSDRTPGAVAALAEELRSAGGVFQINHPALGYTTKGELDHEHLDWGYGYDVEPDSVEVWNIARLYQPPFPSASSNDDAIGYWEGWLDRGAKVTATGGSDNHWVSTTAVQGVGQPTTWVFAREPSVQGILEGIRAGHTFISHQPPNLGGPRLFLEADSGGGTFDAMVGDTVPPGSELRVRVDGGAGLLRIITDGGNEAFAPVEVGPGSTHRFTLPDAATWVRAELVAPDGADVRRATCDEVIGDQTTYCRNQLATLAMTSALYLGRPEPTELGLRSDDSGIFGEETAVSATLTSGSGSVPDRQVEFMLGSARATAETDEDGVATTTLPLDNDPGEYDLSVTFAGDDEYGPSEAFATFTIVRRGTVITYVGDERGRGDEIRLAGQLEDAHDGSLLSERELTFEIDGYEPWTARTNERGIAEVNAHVPDHGRSLEVVVSYDGSDHHEPTRTAATVTWGGDPGRAGRGPSEAATVHAFLASRATSARGGAGPLAISLLMASIVAMRRGHSVAADGSTSR